MKQTLSYYNENAKEFCQATRDADMRYCRDKFLKLLDKQTNSTDSNTNDKGQNPVEPSLHCKDNETGSGKKLRILDAGCGSGRDAKAFMDLGYHVTALDASEKICEEAAKFINQKVIYMPFEEMNFKEEFDGIWACASLLHVARSNMDDVLRRLWAALKESGVLYASFKYGEGEQMINGRFFNHYTAGQLESLLAGHPFRIEEIFMTQDVRPNRENERWVNVLARKL